MKLVLPKCSMWFRSRGNRPEYYFDKEVVSLEVQPRSLLP